LEILTRAWTSFHRNRSNVVIYTVSVLLFMAAFLFVQSLMSSPDETNPPPWTHVVDLFLDLTSAVFSSVIQAVIFARMGRNIDYPLWKCGGIRDALQRFFLPWFIINIIGTILIRFQIQAYMAKSDDLVLLFELFLFLLFLFQTPIATCVMFWGRLDWMNLGETLAPIARLFSLTLPVLFMGFIQWALFISIATSHAHPIVKTLLNLPSPLLDCLAFSAMWHVCMRYRDIAHNVSGDDYDF
jgi:hypothetical protein